VTYLEVLGITVGQLLVGVLGDWVGRRFGLLLDAAIMLLGLLLLTVSWGTSPIGWVVSYAIALFVYGVGVGGEYPMTATSGMENAVGSGQVSIRSDRLHRGRKVTAAFLMQGWGQFLNQVVLVAVLSIASGGRPGPRGEYSEMSAQWTFRISFALPTMGTAWLLYYRASRMKSAGRQLSMAKTKAKVTGYDTTSLRLTFSCFGPRVVATAGAWFCNDVFFYGNKLFQGKFISVISPGNKSVMQGWHYNLINISISLVGYYLACRDTTTL
jgi:MFS family permease